MNKIKVRILGELGKKIGTDYEFAVNRCCDAYAALKANFPEFERFVVEASKQGKQYSMLVHRANGEDEEIDTETFTNKDLQEGDEIWIVPAICGAFIGIVLGAIFIGAGTFLTTGALSTFLIQLGLSLLVSGIISLFADSPKIPTQTQTTSAGANSYFFGGRTNTTQQGRVLPLGYGRLKVGSYVVHSSITSSDIPVANEKVEDNS